MERTIYEVKFADGTTDRTSAPAETLRHEVHKAYVANNRNEVKAHGGIKGFTRKSTYDTRDFE